MCILVLAIEVGGDQLSPINLIGLPLCLLGIAGHIVHKVLFIKSVAGTVSAIDTDDFDSLTRKRVKQIDRKEHSEPLLEDEKWPNEDSDYDVDTNDVLFEVLQRRDGR